MLAAALSTGMCDKAPSGVDYRQCLGRLSETVDVELEREWQNVLAGVRQEDRDNHSENANRPDLESSLQASQKAWQRYRDEQCNMVAAMAAGGTGVGEIEAKCHILMTRKQIGFLQQQAQGDVDWRAIQ